MKVHFKSIIIITFTDNWKLTNWKFFNLLYYLTYSRKINLSSKLPSNISINYLNENIYSLFTNEVHLTRHHHQTSISRYKYLSISPIKLSTSIRFIRNTYIRNTHNPSQRILTFLKFPTSLNNQYEYAYLHSIQRVCDKISLSHRIFIYHYILLNNFV